MYSVSVLLLGPYRPSRLENGYNAKAIAPHLTLFCVASFQGVPKGYQMLATTNELVAPRTRRNTESQKTVLGALVEVVAYKPTIYQSVSTRVIV
jgi:hypothetical protein